MRGSLLLICTLLLPAGIARAGEHPIEVQLRGTFPSISLQPSATLERADVIVGGRSVPGLRPSFPHRMPEPLVPAGAPPLLPLPADLKSEAERLPNVTYPLTFDAPFVVELGSQRVVLRAKGANAASAVETGGELLYERPFPFAEAIKVPGRAGSQELLLLQDQRAARVYEWEIVATEGIAGAVAEHGSIRFLPVSPDHAPPLARKRFAQAPAALRIARPTVIDAAGRRSDTAAQWTLVGDSKVPAAIRLTLSADTKVYPLVVDACFCATGNMAFMRESHTATLLPDGKVLVAGGRDGTWLASAEVYDPGTAAFTLTGSMSVARAFHTATLLPNGKVLIYGGQNAQGFPGTAELYDPATGSFTPTIGFPTTGRSDHTATLLPNGKVFIVNGSTAELYDPATGQFTLTGAPGVTRYNHSATLLQNGKVLIAAGFFSANLNTAQLYDPATGTFSPTGSLDAARFHHTATVLPNGKVLITGGYQMPSGPILSAELYDPGTGTFTPTDSMSVERYFHTATLLPEGDVLIIGGQPGTGSHTTTVEVFDSTTETFGTIADTGTGRAFHTATLLPSGKALIAGGYGIASVELYLPDAGFINSFATLGAGRYGQTSTMLATGKVLVAGGYGAGDLDSAELFDTSLGTFSPTGDLGLARGDHTATLLPNGKVLIAGGTECCDPVSFSSAELYDPGPGTFSGTGSLGKARNSHTATLLPNGKVLIVGGWDRNLDEIVATAELYDPATGLFTPTGSMGTARSTHTATLLATGKVLIAGGENFVSGSLDSAELYDPVTGTFTPTGSLETTRNLHTATLLQGGNVLIAAGNSSQSGGCCLSSAELYDPAAGTFSATGDLPVGRITHTATLLANGEVLIAGGLAGAEAVTSIALYNPLSGSFASADLNTAREWHSATLLTNGNVLIAGGSNLSLGVLDSAEVFDTAQAFAASRRPVIATAPSTQAQPGTMALTGTGFRGDSEASCGTTNSSPTNYPLLHLQRIDNDQTFFIRASVNWSATSFTSATLTGLPAGYYRVTIFTNSIPSMQRLVLFADPSPPPQISINDVTLTEGNSGTKTATFTVSLSAPGGAVTVHYATADDTATSAVTNALDPTPITIGPGGNATPYPTTMMVSGMTGTLAKVTATITGFSHTLPMDVDILLVGPGGQSVVLMSDVGSFDDIVSANLTFDDAAAGFVPPAFFTSGTYRPTNYDDGGPADSYTPPAPAGPYGSALSAFNGTSPNGTWNLYVVDDVSGEAGGISGGWSLTFTTTAADYVPASGTLTFPMGTTSKTVTVTVNGDTTPEFNETFFVNLTDPTNATFADAQGLGTITNDDNPSAPANVIAMANGTISVNINWTAAPGATSYRVYRGVRSGGVITYTLAGSPAGPALTDVNVSANTSYLYKVRSFGTSESGDSNIDLATTVAFTDPTIVAGTTKAKLAHFTELLAAVNAVRTLAGLGAMSFTAPAPSTSVTVRRQHLLDLRTGINAARSTLAIPAITYTDPSVTAGVTPIKAAHVTELRGGVQ